MDFFEQLFWVKYHHGQGKNTTDAEASDQEQTPDWIIKKVAEFAKCHMEDVWDPCLFREFFNMYQHFDALLKSWPHRLIFLNTPFSIAALFLIKCLLEFMRGRNIVLLLPTYSLQTKIFKTLIAPVTHTVDLGLIKFKNHPKPLRVACNEVHFFQPYLWDSIADKGQKKLNRYGVKQVMGATE